MQLERDFRYLIITTLLVFITLPAQATVITIGELAGETPTATYNAPAYTTGNGPYNGERTVHCRRHSDGRYQLLFGLPTCRAK